MDKKYSAVAKLWANYVQSGKRQIEQVPAKYLDEVKEILGQK